MQAKNLVPKQGPKTILIVDDDRDMRDVLESALVPELPDFAFLQATNGADALTLYRRNSSRVALILTDNSMEGGNGSELLSKLRKDGYRVPVIMISGDNQPKFVQQLKTDGLNAFLSKPIEVDQLLKAINAVLMD